MIPSSPSSTPITMSSSLSLSLPLPTSNPPSPRPPNPPQPTPRWAGARPIPLLVVLSLGLLFRFAVPRPRALPPKSWSLLSIFLSAILGLILSPLPPAPWSLLCLAVLLATRTLPFAAAVAAFTNEVIWLIVVSFFFAQGVVRTGLGERVATYFVMWLGGSTLGLGYGLVVGEVVVAPAMPSSTARAGGVFFPLLKSLAMANGSRPEDGTEKKIGAFLVMAQLQSTCSSSALFLTAAAQNLLCIDLAKALGVQISSPWVTWLKFSSLPAIMTLLVTPYFIYKIFPPETKSTPHAPSLARDKLKQMGPVTRNEWAMIGTMLLTVSLWISGRLHCRY